MDATVTGRKLTFSHAVRAANPHLFQAHPPLQVVSRPQQRIRQDPKPLMNKLESAYFKVLNREYPTTAIRPQAKRFRLANGIWYKPDFTAIIDGRETAWEVKGPHAFRGGFENLKVAASTYPEVQWFLVWRDGAGTWAGQEVMP